MSLRIGIASCRWLIPGCASVIDLQKSALDVDVILLCCVIMVPRLFVFLFCVAHSISLIIRWGTSQSNTAHDCIPQNDFRDLRCGFNILGHRSIISDELCNDRQRRATIFALVEVRAMAELSADILQDARQVAQEQTDLQIAFGLDQVTPEMRNVIRQHYLAIATEIARKNHGEVMLACATNLWQQCSHGPRRLIDPHVDSMLLILVCI